MIFAEAANDILAQPTAHSVLLGDRPGGQFGELSRSAGATENILDCIFNGLERFWLGDLDSNQD